MPDEEDDLDQPTPHAGAGRTRSGDTHAVRTAVSVAGNEAFYNQMLSDSHHVTHPGELAQLCNAGNPAYWPSETDVSIRPGWFYHAAEDLRVHSPERMIDIYYRSVGRDNVLLQNLPQDPKARIQPTLRSLGLYHASLGA